MAQSPENIIAELKKGNFSPFYFLHGTEPYFLDSIATYIEDNALEPSSRGFDQSVLYGKDVSIEDIVNAARQFPMMSPKKVVIVREAQEIGNLSKEKGIKLLEGYLENISATTILVLYYRNKLFDKRKSLYKTMDKHGVVVESKKMYDNQVPDWITSFVQQEGHKIDPKAAMVLANNVGNNLEVLTNEIAKILIHFKKEKVNITVDHIEKYVGISKDYNVFEFQSAIARGEKSKCYKIAEYFASNPKNHPVIPLIALLYSFYSRLLLIHQSSDKSERTLGALLRVNPFFLKEYVNATRLYDLGKTMQIIHALHQADQNAKGVNTGPNTNERQILKELLLKIFY